MVYPKSAPDNTHKMLKSAVLGWQVAYDENLNWKVLFWISQDQHQGGGIGSSSSS